MEKSYERSSRIVSKFSVITFLFLNLTCTVAAQPNVFSVQEEGLVGEVQGSIVNARELFGSNNHVVAYVALNSRKSFRLFKSDRRADVFAVNPTEGVLYVKQRIDRETLCPNSKLTDCVIEFSIILSASTNILQLVDDRIDIKIIVLDINDSPPYWAVGSEMHLQFVEAGAGTKINIASAIDADVGPNAKLEYHLENLGAPFKLIQENNKLILDASAQLDREKQANYSMTLKAVDGGSPALTGTVLIKVTIMDINDNTPKFVHTDYSTTQPVREDTPIGNRVLKLEATDLDADVNGKLKFSFSKLDTEEQKLAQNFFKIHVNGDIEVIKKLDYDRMEQKYFAFEAQVEDSAPQPYARSASASVTISVADVNDEFPKVQICFFSSECETDQRPSIAENVPPRSNVAEIRVTDLDYDRKDKVGCMLLDPTSSVSAKFTLQERFSTTDSNHPKTYELKTAGSFDREERSEEQITVECKDDVGHTSRQDVTIIVSDSNDNPPIFQPSSLHLHIEENQEQLPAIITPTVHAVDADEGVNKEIIYSIAPAFHNQFQIDQNTGVISAKQVFDREHKDRFTLQVIATDKGTPPQSTTGTATVTIHDINDCAPRFSQPLSEMSVEENKEENAVVGTVTAQDDDAGLNAKVQYYLVSNENAHDTSFFTINSKSGEIKTRRSLDHEKQQLYHLIVEARDKGTPSLSSTSRVTVHVLNVNDNAPVFKRPNIKDHEFVLRGLEPGQQITTVLAEDADKDTSSITYSIINEMDHLFALDSSGMLYLNKALHGIRAKEWHLKLKACDQGKPNPLCTIFYPVTIRRAAQGESNDSNESSLSNQKGAAGEGSAGSSKPSDNEAIVVFLAIIFGVLLIALVVIIFMLRRKTIHMRKQRKQHAHGHAAGISLAMEGDNLSTHPPNFEANKDLPPMYTDQRRPEGEYLLSQASDSMKPASMMNISKNVNENQHLYTTTTTTPYLNRHKRSMIATEQPERPHSACSVDYQTLDSVSGALYKKRAANSKGSAFVQHATATASHAHQFEPHYSSSTVGVYPAANMHTYYEIKGIGSATPLQTMRRLPISDGICNADMSHAMDKNYDKTCDSGMSSALTNIDGVDANMCKDRNATLSRTQYPYNTYAEASFV